MGWCAQRTRERFVTAMAEIGLHPREFAILSMLADEPRATQHLLAEATGVDSSTMVAAIDGLELRGLAERRVHPEDRRKREVRLTRDGKATLRSAQTIAGKLGEEAFEALSADERLVLHELLAKLSGVDASESAGTAQP